MPVRVHARVRACFSRREDRGQGERRDQAPGSRQGQAPRGRPRHLRRPGEPGGHHEAEGHHAHGPQDGEQPPQVGQGDRGEVDAREQREGQQRVPRRRQLRWAHLRGCHLQAEAPQREDEQGRLQGDEAREEALDRGDGAALASARRELGDDVRLGAAAEGGVTHRADDHVQGSRAKASGQGHQGRLGLHARSKLSVNLGDVHVAEHGAPQDGHGQEDGARLRAGGSGRALGRRR
mmetsp:Transcript_54618/g.169249  ORF Transcript_54618/g.169249 Transcript_54618/m.169249 type:complete len:235 (+) Transcript_54618:2-706(+)